MLRFYIMPFIWWQTLREKQDVNQCNLHILDCVIKNPFRPALLSPRGTAHVNTIMWRQVVLWTIILSVSFAMLFLKLLYLMNVPLFSVTLKWFFKGNDCLSLALQCCPEFYKQLMLNFLIF